jgi:CheY-like chemotaxis protein
MPVTLKAKLIIVVEDPFICKYLRNLLKPGGYQVMEVAPEHGVELVRGNATNLARVS